jgi:signal transduction histidine kinase
VNRDDALQMLASGSNHERLKAARFLMRNAEISDLAALRKARQTETVSYVKTSLNVGIARLSNMPGTAQTDPAGEIEIPEEVKRQIRSQAVEWIAGLLLHEISSPIGLAKRSASREIPDYENSKTKYHLESVQRTFEAIEQLKGATTVPKPERFDLSELLSSLVSEEGGNVHEGAVSLIGPKPLMVTSDPTLVRLAVCNGIRNAIESVAAAKPAEPHPIVINWGETDVDYWVAVLDRGVGIVGPVEPAFEIGKSTKQGHSGFGLAIARQAIETLGGTVRLEPSTAGGARYEARWER